MQTTCNPPFQHRPCIITHSPKISQTNWFNFFKRLWCNWDGVSSVRFCTLWHSLIIYLIVYFCTGTPTARKISWVQESVEKEPGKTVFNLGSCWLHILHDDFRNECNAAKWNIEDSLSCLRWLFKDAPAKREHFTKVSGDAQLHNFALGILGNVSVAERAPQYCLISRCMLMLSKLKQNYQSQQKT